MLPCPFPTTITITPQAPAIDSLLIIWKSNLSDEIRCNFFQEKKPDGICTRMLRAILNKSWKQHPTKQQLYDHLPPFSKTIQIDKQGILDTVGEAMSNS